jgi:two-component system, NtrC family, nitrogen regulation sensor histidine kinase GlnL
MSSPDHRRVLENLTTAVLVLDAELRVLHVNPAAEALFEQSWSRLANIRIDEFILGPEGLVQELGEALRSGRQYTEREKRLVLAGGRSLTVTCTVTPWSDVGGHRLMLEVMQLDRHLRISREDQLWTQHKLARAVVRGLAHEIKNPLGGLRGAAQLLERELAEPSLREYTRIIIGEADRLHKLLDRMLGPNIRPHKQVISIHEVLEHVRQLVAAEAGREVVITSDYDPSLPPLMADPDMLIQAFLNITRNALGAVGDRGTIVLKTRIVRQITIGTQRHRLAIKVDVIDSGPGVPEDLLAQIFYPMVSGREGGTGLGLSIAQTLIGQHGGIIECRSIPGRTEFETLLPLEMTDA